MLHALDETLEKFLKGKLPKKCLQDICESVDSLNVSFETPYGGAITKKPAINLFLYNVQENLDLRNKNWTYERQDNGGAAVKKRLPARVDCSYLITVWIEKDTSTFEHQLLGGVMNLLLRHPTIPEDCLEGELKGQELPLRLVSLRPSGLQSFGEFWQAMGGKRWN